MGVPTGALGVVLERDDGGFSTVGNVGDISGLDLGTGRVEVTSHDAALAGRRRTFVGTLGNEANLSFPLFWDSSDGEHLGLQSDGRNSTLRDFRMTLTDTGAQVLTFSGHVTGFEVTAGVEASNMANVTIGISGDIVVS